MPSFNLVLLLEDYSEINHKGFRKIKEGLRLSCSPMFKISSNNCEA